MSGSRRLTIRQLVLGAFLAIIVYVFSRLHDSSLALSISLAVSISPAPACSATVLPKAAIVTFFLSSFL